MLVYNIINNRYEYSAVSIRSEYHVEAPGNDPKSEFAINQSRIMLLIELMRFQINRKHKYAIEQLTFISLNPVLGSIPLHQCQLSLF